MASTQVPKGLGIAIAIVGLPLILWDAAGTSDKLNDLRAASNSDERRIEQCMTKTAEMIPDASIGLTVCSCVVEKAKKRGAYTDHGSYDEALIGPIVNDCFRGDRD